MKKLLLFSCFLVANFCWAQTDSIINLEQLLSEKIEKDTIASTIKRDTTTYQKNSKISDQKEFETDLKDVYYGKEFEYTDNLKKPEPKKEPKPISKNNFGVGFLFFLGNIFPYVLGILVVIIILKSVLNTEGGNFWNFKRTDTKIAVTKIYQEEEENIDANDYEKLLEMAIKNKHYRLATRYYYLSTLKKLSENKLIAYHIEKTNTDYLFEIKDTKIRQPFSQLSYIYDYVWYGEFSLDEKMFAKLEQKYQQFMQQLN